MFRINYSDLNVMARTTVVIIAFVLQFAAFSLFTSGKQNSSCDDYYRFSDISVWQLRDGSDSSEILWQKRLSDVRDTGSTNNNFNLSNQVLTIGRSSSLGCRGMEVAALDVFSGDMVRTYAADRIHWIEPMTDGYIFVYGDTNVKRVSSEGSEIWMSELPSRAARSLARSSNRLYLPNGDSTQVLSVQDGSLMSVIEGERISSANDELIVLSSDGNFRIVDVNNFQELSSLSLSETNERFGNIERIQSITLNDVVIFFTGFDKVSEVEAYDAKTGVRLWNIDQVFLSLPIVIGNRLIGYGADDELLFYDMYDGTLSNRILMSRVNEKSTHETTSVWLAGENNVISIFFKESNELLTIRFDF